MKEQQSKGQLYCVLLIYCISCDILLCLISGFDIVPIYWIGIGVPVHALSNARMLLPIYKSVKPQAQT